MKYGLLGSVPKNNPQESGEVGPERRRARNIRQSATVYNWLGLAGSSADRHGRKHFRAARIKGRVLEYLNSQL